MQNLKQEELNDIEGGAVGTLTKWTIVGGVVTFLIGFFNGYQRPLGCSSTK